jgi:6-phosphofructokinase 1
MKFGILTGGGDCPGMNSFIRAVVRIALNLRPQTSVWGVIDGWKGLSERDYRRLSNADVSGLCTRGGTILGTVRFPELEYNEDVQQTIARNLHDDGFDYLFVCGGNGSLRAANTINNILQRDNLKTKIMFAPGSIDNDVVSYHGTSIGFLSAVDKSLEMLEWIRDTASSHRRIYLVRSMGRDSGFLGLFSGIVAGAEYFIRPREEVDFEKLATVIEQRDRDTRIIVSEAYKLSLDEIKDTFDEIFARRGTTREIRTVDMGYFQRGGKAAVSDILRASWLAFLMVKDAFNMSDSGFYTAFYTGHKGEVLQLNDTVDKSEHVSDDVSDDIVEFALSLRSR